MRVLIINNFGQSEIKNTEAIPGPGDKVDMFFHPRPTVDNVLFWPSKETLDMLPGNVSDIDAIITVS